MTVNELIFNFRINVENGGVLAIDKDGNFIDINKNILDEIGNEEIKGQNMFDGKLFVHIDISL